MNDLSPSDQYDKYIQKTKIFWKKLLAGGLGFKFYWTSSYFLASMLAAILIGNIDSLPFIDALFQGVAVGTTAALTTVEMSRLTGGSFVVMAVIGVLMSSAVTLLPTLIYRRTCFAAINKKIILARSQGLLQEYKDLSKHDRKIIDEYNLLDKSLRLLSIVIGTYVYVTICIGFFVILAALYTKPNLPELEARGFTRFDNAIMLTFSGFANTGLCIASDSLIPMADNPFAYLTITVLIVLGHTGIPIALRILLTQLLKLEEYLHLRRDYTNNDKALNASVEYRQSLQFILDHPRKHTTHLFSTEQTVLLGRSLVALCLIQYVFFLGASLNRPAALGEYHNKLSLAGVGYFQSFSTRSAGFTILDLRALNSGLIVIYSIMMYVAATPFVSVLYETTTSVKELNNDEKDTQSDAFDMLEEDQEDLATSYVDDVSTPVPTASSDTNNTNNSSYNTNDNNNTNNTSMSYITPLFQPLQLLQNPMQVLQPLPHYKKVKHNQSPQHTPSRRNPMHEIETPQSSLRHRNYTSSSGEGKGTLAVPPADTQQQSLQPQQPTFARKFLLRHSFVLLLCLLLLSFSQDHLLTNPDFQCNLWYIMFEIIAAYGGPGLSMGVPGKNYSLSGEFTPLGKCVIMLLMLMGISRGLPSRHDECVDFKFEKYCTACGYKPTGDTHQIEGEEEGEKERGGEGVEMVESGEVSGGVKGVYNPLSQQ